MSIKHFRLGTFNVFNLVREGVAYYNKSPYSHDEFEEKIDWIGRQLDYMEADLVGFQEVFHKDALLAALSKSKRFRDVEPIILGTKEDEQPAMTPVVAFASRFEVTTNQAVTYFPDDAVISGKNPEGKEVIVPVKTFSRPVLNLKVKITDSLEVTVFVAHLKSKRPIYLEGESKNNPLHRTLGSARSLIRRAAEAAALRALILSEIRKTKTPLIVLGDVNDGSLAVTTQMIAGEKPYYRWRKQQKEPYWDVLLYTAQEIQARDSTRDIYFTHIYNGFYEALDHVLISEEFYAPNPDRVAEVDYVQIFNDHIIDETQAFEEIPRTRSDHGQVVARIRILST